MPIRERPSGLPAPRQKGSIVPAVQIGAPCDKAGRRCFTTAFCHHDIMQPCHSTNRLRPPNSPPFPACTATGTPAARGWTASATSRHTPPLGTGHLAMTRARSAVQRPAAPTVQTARHRPRRGHFSVCRGPCQTRNTSPAAIRSILHSCRPWCRCDGPFPTRCRPVPYQNTAARSLPGPQAGTNSPACRFPAQPATVHSPCLCGCRDNQHTASHCPRCQPVGSSRAPLSPCRAGIALPADAPAQAPCPEQAGQQAPQTKKAARGGRINKEPLARNAARGSGTIFGSGLLSHMTLCSIIGDGELNFRVRNGVGCTLSSMATKEILSNIITREEGVFQENKTHGLLVLVSSIPRGTSTSSLSTRSSTSALQDLRQGELILRQASRLDAFSGYPFHT